MTQSEEWRAVVEYEGLYEVSDAGRVRSLDRRTRDHRSIKGRVLKPYLDRNDGRPVVTLRDVPLRRVVCVHTLVAVAFLGPRPDGQEVCHGNGDPADNRVENLRYDTSSANKFDAVKHGVHTNAAKTHCKRGHAFTPENTRRQAHGGRACKTCHNLTNRRYIRKAA